MNTLPQPNAEAKAFINLDRFMLIVLNWIFPTGEYFFSLLVVEINIKTQTSLSVVNLRVFHSGFGLRISLSLVVFEKYNQTSSIFPSFLGLIKVIKYFLPDIRKG